MFDLLSGFVCRAGAGMDWSHWPFGPGMTGSWLMTLSKFAFMGVILAIILGILRYFFGPGGMMRDPEMDREAEEERREIRKSVNLLRERLARGEISEEEFERTKRILER